MDLDKYIRTIKDFPTAGVLFKDITPLLANPEAFAHAIKCMIGFLSADTIDSIAAVESRGFILAAPIALHLKKPLVLLRKPGKLPYKTTSETYALEYGSAQLHMHTDSVKLGDRVALVDDVLATGGTMKASADLIQKSGGVIAACGFLIEIKFLNGRQKLSGFNCQTVLSY